MATSISSKDEAMLKETEAKSTNRQSTTTLTPGEAEKGIKEEESNSSAEKKEEADPNLVTWDGPNDQSNPKNWSFKRRWAATALVSLITFMTPVASSMIAPSAGVIDADFGITSTIQSALVFSIFLLPFIFGPLFIAPLSEVYGRIVTLQCANVWFLIFNLVCGFSQTEGQLIAFRFLSGIGACAPQTVGGGVLSDLWTSEERGKAVAIYTLAPILSPALGPLIGAWITERTTWRWSFWAVTIFGVTVLTLCYFTLSETYGPRILHVKAQKLRKQTGNERLHTAYEIQDRRTIAVLRHASARVFVLLGTQPVVQFLATYMALNYGVIYLMLYTFPNVWTDIYNESIGIGGLNYISLAIGLVAGTQIAARLIDTLYKKLRARNGGEGQPEYRIPILFASTLFTASGLFIYGWTAQYHVFWLVPNIGAVIFGIGVTMTMTGIQTYTIDTYQLYAASAVGCTAVARSITGFSFPLFAEYMFDALGYGWGNMVLGFGILVVGYGGSLILWFYGRKLREKSPYCTDKN